MRTPAFNRMVENNAQQPEDGQELQLFGVVVKDMTVDELRASLRYVGKRWLESTKPYKSEVYQVRARNDYRTFNDF